MNANGVQCFEEAVLLLPWVIKMNVTQCLEQAAEAAWADEIEEAIANAKRIAEDKRFRKEWWRAG